MIFRRKGKHNPKKEDEALGIEMKLHPLTLHFVDDQAYLEKEYRDFYFKESVQMVRITLLLALVFYVIFGWLDAAITAPLDPAVGNPIKKYLWLIRFAIVSPFIFSLFILSYYPVFKKYFQFLVGMSMFVAGFGIIVMVYRVAEIGIYTYYAGLMLVFIFGYTFVRARIISATIAGWSLVIIYEVVAYFLTDTPPIERINNNFFFISANVIGMVVCYSLDRVNRRDFFMRKLLEVERNKVEAANEVLEEKVRERTRQLEETNVELKKEIELRKQYEKERTKLESQLMQLQKMETIGTLAGGIAHDFNNILTPILGYTEMALEEIEEDNTLRFDIEQINHAALRAKDLVKQILTFSRQMEVEKKPSNLKDIIEEVLNLVRASLPKNIEIVADLDQPCGTVMVDTTQIHQVIMNLCTNASHAMTPDGGTLILSLSEVELDAEAVKKLNKISPGTYACISVSDTGIGMDQQTINRIFEPFFTKKEVGVGSGLGLAVVHGIINSYRGAITVKSEPGKGTTFRVYLPLFEEPQEIEVPEEYMKTGMERIMFVDDEEEITFIGKKMLESLGYSVTIRTDGNRAFQEFKRHPEDYDLLVTDQIMPGLLGTNLAAKFRQLNPKLKVIIITGAKESVNEKLIDDYHIDELLLKPLKLSEFSKVIRDVLNSNHKDN
jgi:signal transduction histidine kinase/CheY-like chemotaxis protein